MYAILLLLKLIFYSKCILINVARKLNGEGVSTPPPKTPA